MEQRHALQLRPSAEQRFADELAALRAADQGRRPPGWTLSARAVRSFILGDSKLSVRRKFYGDDALVERALVALMSEQGLMLVGEPGTAKSMLSELLAAAISGSSMLVVQGSTGVTEDHVRYGWNYALLIAEGPTPRALVPSPVMEAMRLGRIVRVEELTRCPPEIQDILISVLSEKMMTVPELGESASVYAAPGFSVIGTANLRDRGVHEMSSALKRRFNFETVHPIRELELEVDLVVRECERLLVQSSVQLSVDRSVIELLVTAFQDLREGKTAEGISVERPTSVMSTAEAVSVAMSAGLDAYYFGGRRLIAEHVARHLAGAVLKDNPDDLSKLKQYFDVVVRQRSKQQGGTWTDLLNARKWLP
jgi:MoxR-like ATPase